MKNITLSADERHIERAREFARSQKKSLNDAFREWLEQYGSRAQAVKAVDDLYEQLKHVRVDRKFSRDEMNERR